MPARRSGRVDAATGGSPHRPYTHPEVDRLMLHETTRREIAQMGVRLEAEGLLGSTAGNLSRRLDSELIAITPSGIRYPEIEPGDVVVTDLAGSVVDGRREPSSELPFHTAIYRARPDVGGVVHTHSPYSTVLAILRRPIPAVHYAIASLRVTEVPVVPYATYGSELLAAQVASVIGSGANGALLANHGAVAVGADLQEAATNAAVLEFLAVAFYRTLVAGGGFVLPADEIARVVDRYRSYGQPRAQVADADASAEA